MKSQDIVILLKLVSLEHQEHPAPLGVASPAPAAYRAAEVATIEGEGLAERYSARGLEAALGISKSEVNASINRSLDIGMAFRDRSAGVPRANVAALLEFIVHGLKYVFPARPGAIVRGIPTAAAAPVLEDRLMSAGEFIYVWPDPRGEAMGQSVQPLFKSVPEAIRRDSALYAYLALVDAIRLGNPRESKLAARLLEHGLNA